MDRHTTYDISGPVQKRPTKFSRNFTQQCIPTDINQIFSCFTVRWCKHQHYPRFSKLCYLWKSLIFFWNWRWKSEKSRRDFLEMFTWRSGFSDVIPREIHKHTKYTCHNNSRYRYLVITFWNITNISMVKMVDGSWFNLE